MNSQLQTQLERERGKNHDLRSQLSELNQEKEDTITRLTSQLLETKKETRKGKKLVINKNISVDFYIINKKHKNISNRFLHKTLLTDLYQ